MKAIFALAILFLIFGCSQQAPEPAAQTAPVAEQQPQKPSDQNQAPAAVENAAPDKNIVQKADANKATDPGFVSTTAIKSEDQKLEEELGLNTDSGFEKSLNELDTVKTLDSNSS